MTCMLIKPFCSKGVVYPCTRAIHEGIYTRVVRKFLCQPLFKWTKLIASVIIYINIFNNVSRRNGENGDSTRYIFNESFRHYAICGAGVRIIMTF